MFDDLRRPPKEKSQMHVFHEFLRRREETNNDQQDLYEHLQSGIRPVFGIPHIAYKDKSPKTAQDFEKQMRENWQLLSKAVLKDVGGRSEVQQILEQVHHHKDEENAFLRNMQQGKSHKAGKLAETHGKCTTKCSHGLNETLRSSSLENTQKMVNYFQKQD